MKLTGENRSTRGKTCPSATLSTTNLTGTDPGSNPCLRGGRPATNSLSHGTACGPGYATKTSGFYLHDRVQLTSLHALCVGPSSDYALDTPADIIY
jgi:hypothetical protein